MTTSASTSAIGRADAAWLASRLDGRSAGSIAQSITELVSTGVLADGTQLPTIRDVASAASVSTGTVAEAWARLRDGGLVETRRRGGTTITAGGALGAEPRAAAFPGWPRVDLVQCSPDVSLQPPLGEALAASLTAENINAWGREYMTERLRTAVEPDWPFAAQAWMTAGGGTEALLIATAAAAPRGSLVAIDEPVVPGFLDTLRDLGLTAVGVQNDEHGPLPGSLEDALRQGPAAFIYQPGAPFAVSHRLSAERTAELGELLQRFPEVNVIEDDSIGPLAESSAPSIGGSLPDRILRIRSYCKAYGTDLRTSVIGGGEGLVSAAIRQRSYGVGSNSRLLQNALAYLIEDRAAARIVEGARERYAARKAALLTALDTVGLRAGSGPASLVVWIEVPDESRAFLALASRGIVVGAGRMAFVDEQPRGLLRVSVMQLPDRGDEIDKLARLIAGAADGSLREYFD